VAIFRELREINVRVGVDQVHGARCALFVVALLAAPVLPFSDLPSPPDSCSGRSTEQDSPPCIASRSQTPVHRGSRGRNNSFAKSHLANSARAGHAALPQP